jgi:dTDP-4-dehydro-6-deoxy-alpha-D-glucopyranose 2,3-dehydratase
MTDKNQKHLSFLNSALTEENPFISTPEVIQWLNERNKAVHVKVRKVKFKDLNQWRLGENGYNLKHNSDKFFSIDGIRVHTNNGDPPQWDQPIINQPEIGYLGFITKKFNEILYFLVQAKIEPGNVNNVQLSPTLQATKSNYSRVHKGKSPRYLEFFKDRDRCKILLDQLQSEQGARFLYKRNRNIIVETEEDISVHEDFIWLTLGQIKNLIQHDNLVNMDTRTVISGIPYGSFSTEIIDFFKSIDKNRSIIGINMLDSALKKDNSLLSNDEIIAWFTELKCNNDLSIEKIPLTDVEGWIIDDYEIRHKDNKYFKVIATEIEISNREVSKWMQPLVQPAQDGLIAFIIKKINGTYHFLVQAKLESGNFDILEMAPTVQCLTGNYREDTTEGGLPFLETVIHVPQSSILYDTLQSEEGGRFYQEQNRNLIIEVGSDFEESVPESYCWMTLNQLYSFLKYNNYLNIQARSLISSISFI